MSDNDMDPDAKELLEHASRAVATMRRMDEGSAALFGGGLVAVLKRELRKRLGKQSYADIALQHGKQFMSDLHAQAMVEDEAMRLMGPWADCHVCQRRFQTARRNSVYCSGACKQKAYRQRSGA